MQDLLAEGRLRRHETSADEVSALLQVSERDLADAVIAALSTDRRFATAYNGALALATMVLHAAGYRASGAGHHWVTLRALPLIMGEQFQAKADYFDQCRSKRNIADYDRVGEVADAQVAELVAETRTFQGEVLQWLRAIHPQLAPEG
ncbi:MAG TPA: hypothetical protein VM221_01330 [Armatimonadota bacterium]|nr:hypothetical protein [Armatimonadota bacterium]